MSAPSISSCADPTTTTTTTATAFISNSNSSTIQDQRAKSVCQFRERLLPGVDIVVDLTQILYSATTPFQQVDIITTTFGKTLVTDGKTQSSAFDEKIYHESLVHPALLSVGDQARTVFIGGGGELATAREVLRHSRVERVVMVDLDVMVIDACRRFLPEWGGDDVYDHAKFQLVIGDAYQYLMETTEQFDVIIMDISDPIEAGPGNLLYTKEFYQHANRLLKQPHGVFVTQAGMAESVPSACLFVQSQQSQSQQQEVVDPSCHAPIFNTLKSVFTNVQMYTTNIPSYGSDWGFVMANNNNQQQQQNGDHGASTATTSSLLTPTAMIHVIDESIERYITGGAAMLQHYDGITHQRMFHLTKPLRQQLEQDNQRIITKANPIYMY